MTTLAIPAGMLHVALGLGADALVAIGGPTTSTPSLLVTTAYTYMDRFEPGLQNGVGSHCRCLT